MSESVVAGSSAVGGSARTAMRFGVVAVAVAALVLVACRDRGNGGDEDPGTPTATVRASVAPTPTQAEATATASTPAAIGPDGGEFEQSVVVDGDERTWRLYVPDDLPDGKVPLLIGLHGGFGSGAQFADTTRFDEQADAGGFIAAYPNGTGTVPTWNAGRCCGYAARESVGDEAFIDAMISQIVAEYPIEQAAIYAVGHSNGGMLALRLACQLAYRFAAVAVVGASLEVPVEGCFPSKPVSVLLIHGDADENHPIGGGQGPNSFADVDFNSVAKTMESMRSVMGCSTDTEVTASGAVTTTEWAGCGAGVTVRQQIIAGGSHAWPGGKPGLGLGGAPTDAMDATTVIGDFFQTHLTAVP